jgi:polyhydroxyalkanoate synthesis repressor PhaR
MPKKRRIQEAENSMQKAKAAEAKPGGQAGGKKDGKVVVIKKYANRRLYNTATSSYVTLDHLCQMVKDDVDFVVYDAKSGEDITRSVLTQIIVEEESKGSHLLPINFLRQLIGYYGDNMEWMVPRYLEHMMGALQKNQEQLRQSMQDTLGGMFPFGNLEEMGKQNVALFERAMKMFTPFGPEGTAGKAEEAPPREESADEQLRHLRLQVEALQKQLQELSRKEK